MSQIVTPESGRRGEDDVVVDRAVFFNAASQIRGTLTSFKRCRPEKGPPVSRHHCLERAENLLTSARSRVDLFVVKRLEKTRFKTVGKRFCIETNMGIKLLLCFTVVVSFASDSSQSFCGSTSIPGMDNTVRLRCNDPSAVIVNISFASFGTPNVSSRSCEDWTIDNTCNSNVSVSVIETACLYKSMCAVPTFDVLFGGDPCPHGGSKLLAIVAECSGGSGGSANSGNSCAMNGTACPLPLSWKQWNLTMSTMVEPGGDLSPEYFLFDRKKPWGLTSLDWSVANTIWHNDNQNLSTVEATLTENCRLIKEISPNTRCFLYHNLELGLQAFESNREVMYDVSKVNWFVRINGNGSIYNEPGGPGDQYFFDFRNKDAADWYIETALKLTSSPYVDGIFTDDYEGFPSEHDYAPINTNTSYEDVAALQFASLDVHGRLVSALAAVGKYNWQAMGDGYQGEYAQPGVPHDVNGCSEFLRSRCVPSFQQKAMTMNFDSNFFNQSIAAFLIVRGPVAFLGYAWESGNDQWHPSFLYDVGEPLGLCQETSQGIFTRAWTHGDARLDCNTFSASVPAYV